MSIVLFSYKTTYKVATCYTPYYLVYGLHPLMPTKYVLLAISGDHKDAEPIIVLIIVVTYEIRVFFKGAQKEVFSSIFKKTL